MAYRTREKAAQWECNSPSRSRYAPWRAACLILVYVLMAIHITHWLVAGKTLAPLELNEVMYTFELGIITAGFVFMTIALLATAIFGRFFCSWGCHILALQDLCTWILKKLNMRPIGVRSRLLLWVPAVVAAYMFAWPQVLRIGNGQAPPALHLRSDAEGWASFATEDFWRNLPGPGVAVATFAVCGFLIVYVLGSRAFCAYGCPYGAVFAFADRIAPGRIRVGEDCTQCGACTAACTSHVRVHEELNRFGMVVNPACMKDLDCISACSQQSLHYGLGRPSLVKLTVHETPVRKRYDFALWEEGIMIVTLVLTLVIYRGLYDVVPFFLSIALGAIFAYLTIVLIRLTHSNSVKLNRWQLKNCGHISSKGYRFVGLMAVLGLFSLHSAIVRYDEFRGHYYFAGADSLGPAARMAEKRAVHHLERSKRLGLVTSVRTDAMLADLYLRQGKWLDAEQQVQRVLASDTRNTQLYINLGTLFAQHGRYDDAERLYQASLTTSPSDAHTYYALAGLYFETKRTNEAANRLRKALECDAQFAEAHFDLGALLVEQGALNEGILHLQQAVGIRPDFADAHYNLAVAFAMMNRIEEAAHEIETARNLNPTDKKSAAFQRHLAGLRKQQ